MAKAKATAAQRQHMADLAEMPCVLCAALGMEQSTKTTIHHIRHGQGMAQRSSHWLTVPLCQECHQGDEGTHGDKSRLDVDVNEHLLNVAKLQELDLLAFVVEAMAGKIRELQNGN